MSSAYKIWLKKKRPNYTTYKLNSIGPKTDPFENPQDKVAFSRRRRLMVIKQKILFGKIETSLMLI